MLSNILKNLKNSLLTLIVCMAICGVIYPVLVTLIGQILFPWQANGSLLMQGDKYVGSALIGQHFTANKYFWGRPSATKPFPYNALESAGSNLGPTNPLLKENVAARIAAIKTTDFKLGTQIPIDLVTTSASGLDPEISARAATLQIPRISKARGLEEKVVYDLIVKNLETKLFGQIGLDRVNVLRLNLALDATTGKAND